MIHPSEGTDAYLMALTFVVVELGRLFPSIPLVGEEDSRQLRIDYENSKASGNSNKTLVESIVDVLSLVPFPGLSKLDCETVLTAIDRGAMSLAPLDGGQARQSSYWVSHKQSLIQVSQIDDKLTAERYVK